MYRTAIYPDLTSEFAETTGFSRLSLSQVAVLPEAIGSLLMAKDVPDNASSLAEAAIEPKLVSIDGLQPEEALHGLVAHAHTVFSRGADAYYKALGIERPDSSRLQMPSTGQLRSALTLSLRTGCPIEKVGDIPVGGIFIPQDATSFDAATYDAAFNDDHAAEMAIIRELEAKSLGAFMLRFARHGISQKNYQDLFEAIACGNYRRVAGFVDEAFHDDVSGTALTGEVVAAIDAARAVILTRRRLGGHTMELPAIQPARVIDQAQDLLRTLELPVVDRQELPLFDEAIERKFDELWGTCLVDGLDRRAKAQLFELIYRDADPTEAIIYLFEHGFIAKPRAGLSEKQQGKLMIRAMNEMLHLASREGLQLLLPATKEYMAWQPYGKNGLALRPDASVPTGRWLQATHHASDGRVPGTRDQVVQQQASPAASVADITEDDWLVATPSHFAPKTREQANQH